MLPEIADAVKGKITILVDGGIRTGNDIFRCLALGADGVLIGRPFALSIVQGGSAQMIALGKRLQDELAETMRMTGCSTLAQIDRIKIRY